MLRWLVFAACVALCNSFAAPPRSHMHKHSTQEPLQVQKFHDVPEGLIPTVTRLSVRPAYFDLPLLMMQVVVRDKLDKANETIQEPVHKHSLVMIGDEMFGEDGTAQMHTMADMARKSNASAVSPGDPGAELQLQQGFVKITARIQPDDTTDVEVEIASPNTIIAVFVVMYSPIISGWMYYFWSGCPANIYFMLLPLTLCTTLIGDNFVNKSLAVLMGAPMVITACQAGAMACVSALFAFVQLRRHPKCLSELMWPLVMWTSVAAMFTLYQLMNHLVALYCSLAERTVFTNLCPVVSLMFEVTIMPANLKATATFKSKVALALLVVGAIIFSVQYPDFSASGVAFAMLMVAAVVPYRLAQRYALSECRLLPVMLLVMYDGVFLATPSSAIAAVEQPHFMSTWDGWMSDSSVVIMLVLSSITFTSNHIFALLMLGVNSATALQVYQNLSNFVVVTLGILFFGDKVMDSPMVCIGLLICLFAGLWYAIEVQPKSTDEKTEQPARDPVQNGQAVPPKSTEEQSTVPAKDIADYSAAAMLHNIKK